MNAIQEQVGLFCDSTKNTLTTYFEKITPEVARNLLNINDENNRKVNPRVVASYANQMVKGLWHEDSGETIKISQSGKIIDGQHRLHAIVKASQLQSELGKGKFHHLNMLIISGVPDSAKQSIDDGFKRTLGNAFDMSGKALKNQSAVNGALKVLYTLRGCAVEGLHYDTITSRRVSTAEMMNFYDALPKFKEVATKYFSTFKYTKVGYTIPSGMALALYYLFHDVDADKTYSIFKTMETGIPFDDLRESSPSFHLVENTRRNKAIGVRIRPPHHVQNFLWCFAKTLEGKPVHQMPKNPSWKFSTDNLIQAQIIKKLRCIND